MLLKDLKNYRSYLPIKQERNEIIYFINELIGNNWINMFWFNKFSQDFIVRYRFGNKNVVQIYLKNKSWYNIPLHLWFKFSPQNKNKLDQDCISFIHDEQLKLKMKNVKSNDFLTI